MTFNELKERVAHLGFERLIEDDSSLRNAAGCALSILFTDRPQVSTAKVYVDPPMLTRVYKSVGHTGGAQEAYQLCGSAFSFLPHGDGEYSLICDETVTRVKFSAGSGYQKGLIPNGEATLLFEGELDYTLTDLAVFAGSFCLNASEVPEYSEMRTVDPSELIGDFGSLASVPRLPSGRLATGVRVAFGKITLPFSFRGELVIDYYRLPRKIDTDNVDVPVGLEHLFALLTASFVWLDDDAEKAQYYMALYRDGIAAINARSRLERHAEYATDGWA